MLFVNRNRVVPSVKLLQLLKKETVRAEKFFKRVDRGQQRFDFNASAWRSAWEYLNELFWGTCAFCEAEIVSPVDGDVTQFRPRVEACNLDNETDADWYWWLAYEWENLYLVCHTCNLNKKNYFPVIGARAKVGAKGRTLGREKILLLDPCKDEPTDYLHFSDEGLVQSISLLANASSEGIDRGETTIQVFALNRTELIDARKAAIAAVMTVMDLIIKRAESEQSKDNVDDMPPPLAVLVDNLFELIDEFGSFVAAKRQATARRLSLDKALYQILEQRAKGRLGKLLRLLKKELKAQEILNPLEKTEKAISAAELRKTAPTVDIQYENAFIRSIKIHNFRAIEDFEIKINEWTDLGSANSELKTNLPPEDLLTMPVESEQFSPSVKKVGWKMLLGENGAGKSSVLKALSLALMGEKFHQENADDYRLRAEQIFNKNSRKDGYIYVELSKGESIQVEFTRKKLQFISGKTGGASVYVRGYGAARLFSRNSRREKQSSNGKELKDVANLFHPEILLADPNAYLAELSDEDFNSTALSLRDLLNLPKEIKNPLIKKKSGIFLDSGFGHLPLEEQSDGYNSILALLVDILAGLPKSMRDKREATGIVLLDEIDAHLHPRWKMRIVASLRRTFPNFQFISTTHEPLCLRGLGAGEITIMKREDKKTIIQDNLPATTGLRVDQLLTSELFGLESTIDPDVDEKFYNYYRLLAEPVPETKQKAEEREQMLEQFKRELQRYNILGFTRRDQLVYELIDEYLAQEKKITDKDKRESLKQETKKKVFDIWEMVKARQETMQ